MPNSKLCFKQGKMLDFTIYTTIDLKKTNYLINFARISRPNLLLSLEKAKPCNPGLDRLRLTTCMTRQTTHMYIIA